MKTKALYISYGTSILVLGLIGFLLTHAKSALISGLASGLILIALGFFVEKSGIAAMAAKVVNILLIGVFTWRSTLALTAFLAGAAEKMIPAILLVLMAAVSVGAFATSFIVKD